MIEKSELEPRLLMVFYESEDSLYSEYAQIYKHDIGPYLPLTYDVFEALAEKAKKNKMKPGAKKPAHYYFKKFIPRNVLHFNDNAINVDITWIVKGAVREIHFLQKKPHFIYYPHLVFRVHKEKLFVFAVKTTNITPDTVLYHCPFPNIYDDGHMCFGSMTFSDFLKDNYEKTMLSMEDAFFSSKFTNAIVTKKIKVPMLALLEKTMVKKKEVAKHFPINVLKEYKKYKDVFS